MRAGPKVFELTCAIFLLFSRCSEQVVGKLYQSIGTTVTDVIYDMIQLKIKKGTSVARGKMLVKVIGCNDANREATKLNVQVCT